MQKVINLLKVSFFIAFFSLAYLGNATTYYSKSTGNLTLTATWGDISDGSGNSPSSFASTNSFVICNRTSATLSGPGLVWSFLTTSTLTIGDGSPIDVILNSGVSLEDMTINVSANATLTLNDLPANLFSDVNGNPSFGFNDINSGSTIIYNSAGSIVQVPWLNSQLYGKLLINDDASLSGGTIGSIQTNTLEIASSKTLELSTSQIQIRSEIIGSGSLAATSGSIFFNISSQSGNRGTLFVNGTINTLRMNGTPSAFITLGTDVKITGSGGAFLNNNNSGLYDLNGHTLTLDNNFQFGGTNSLFKGSTTSAILISAGSGSATTANLRFDPSFNTLKSLTINRAGSSITIASNTLNISDSVSILAGTLNTGGLLTLKATSALKGRIGRVGGTISGNVTVETYIPGATTGWANLGTNGISGLTVANWDAQIPMTCNGCSNATTSIPGGFASITEWDEVTDTYVTCSNTNPLTIGKGFWVYVGSGFSSTTDFTLSNNGTPKIGSGTIPVTRTSSNSASPNFASNLISNPYASPISWTKLRAMGSNNTLVNSAIYVWNADLASGAGAMTSYVAGAGSPGGGAIGDDIPAGQGFFVDALAAGSLTYDESIKTAANTSATPLLKTSATNDYGKIFRLKIKGANDWDAAVFRIHENATPQFDQEWDAKKVFQSPGYAGYPGPYTYYTTLSSKDASGFDYSIQSIPSLSESTSIPVLARVSATGSYTIVALETENVHDCIMLKDKLTNTTTDLKLSNYVFTISDTTSAPRFELILCKDESLNTVGVSQNASESNSILIGQDATNAFVKTVFEKNTKASISVFNIMGQKLVNDIQVEGTVTTTALPLELHNQVVLIKVTTDKESVTKKVVLH